MNLSGSIDPATRASCPFCSLLCSDLRLRLEGNRLADFAPHCALGEAGFRAALAAPPGPDPERTPLLETARAWLREARQPLVVLSGGLDGEAASAAVRLARRHSAVLACDEDRSGSLLGLAMQASGFLTATLGNLRSLELAVLCGVDPDRTHPRLGEALGRDLAKAALRLDPPDPLEALRWLRLAGAPNGGNLPETFARAAARIASAASGLVIFGPEWLRTGLPFATELLLWLADLNRTGRWFGLYLPPEANSLGVADGLLAETGYSGNLRFDPQGVQFSPRLWRAERLIQQGSLDVCLLAGQPVGFSEKTLARLAGVRTILVDPQPPAWGAPLWIPAARPGLDAPGRMQRLDGLPVDLPGLRASPRPPAAQILLELLETDR